MPTPKIVAVATATPPHRYTQADIMDAAGYTDPQRRAFFERSDIESRYLWIPRERLRPDESVDELAARARDGALALSEAAARRALERAGWQATDVDFIATTTCTARLPPSIDAHLVGRLGCRPDVQRAHIGDTGCASAMVALQQAWNHLRAFPSHRALLVSVEICSAAYFLDDRLESAVAHAIFADGAGALALSTEGPGPRVVAHRTLFRRSEERRVGKEGADIGVTGVQTCALPISSRRGITCARFRATAPCSSPWRSARRRTSSTTGWNPRWPTPSSPTAPGRSRCPPKARARAWSRTGRCSGDRKSVV